MRKKTKGEERKTQSDKKRKGRAEAQKKIEDWKKAESGKIEKTTTTREQKED